MVGWVDLFVCFFFQAEDGIRDGRVTGVQTCALPISTVFTEGVSKGFLQDVEIWQHKTRIDNPLLVEEDGAVRSEERRVGKSVDLGGRRIIKKKKKKRTRNK